MVAVLVGVWSWRDQAENWQTREAGGTGEIPHRQLVDSDE